MIICGIATLRPGEHGKPAIMVDEDRYCDECGHAHSFEKCPDCGAWITPVFGLMQGGFGEHKYCNDECGWTWHNIFADDEE